MTRPRVVRLLLMLDPSFSRSPEAPVLFARSEPARSTSDRRDTFTPLTPDASSVSLNVTTIVNTAWDLNRFVNAKEAQNETCWIRCSCSLLQPSATCSPLHKRYHGWISPPIIRSSISWASSTHSCESPSTYGPSTLCSRTCAFVSSSIYFPL